MILLEYEEDISRRLQKRDDYPTIDIEEAMVLNDSKFHLIGIINFQSGHYTTYIKGCYHPKITPKQDSNWFYHDEKLNKGFLMSKDPKFKINVSKDKILPYILIYKMI
jgi:hypothetical protein